MYWKNRKIIQRTTCIVPNMTDKRAAICKSPKSKEINIQCASIDTSYCTVSVIGWISGATISWHTGQILLWVNVCLSWIWMVKSALSLPSHCLSHNALLSDIRPGLFDGQMGIMPGLFRASLWAVFHGKTIFSETWELWNSLVSGTSRIRFQ